MKGYGPQGFRECQGDYRDEADREVASQPLYRFQQSRPRLSVLTLADTVALYVETIEPLASVAEFAHTTRRAKEFLASGSVGHELQQRLTQRAADRHDTSYLAEWWHKGGYLAVRDPVVCNVSYFFHFADRVAARDHGVPPTSGGRLAGAGAARSEEDAVCATAYKFFRIELLDPVSGRAYGFEQLVHQLQRVVADAGAKESAIGVLTSADRDHWADARDELVRTGNAAALRAIESAVVVVNLDDARPVSRTEVARALWHGDGRNRFYDKCIQLVVFENGKAGLMGEHSMLDGMPMVRYADYMMTRLHKAQIQLQLGQTATCWACGRWWQQANRCRSSRTP
jgi:carnitine O-acetyltransferase